MTHSYHYDIHGILRIASMQRLPELASFQVGDSDEVVDVRVHVVRRPHLHRRADSIVYEEFLGRYGFSVVINRTACETEVFVSPLIGASPHVLYTNVVEPLLRWSFVRSGYALMHGACIAFDSQALFLTARTDTGKTTTILHALRENLHACEFLSDDMTIFDAGGRVFGFPKPLTISRHTLQAAGGAPLTRRERAFLQIQSRLHSRGGRRTGMWLSANAMPAATLNAIVQRLIPPPKFMVDRLIPDVRSAHQARLAGIVLLERGATLEEDLDPDDTVGILLANADDAYGFPPYPVLAERLRRWNGRDLQAAERAIVASAIENLSGVRLRSPDYGWHKRLPDLVESMRRRADVGSPARPLEPTAAPASVPAGTR
jgi:dolichol-phosphate mannosyltransferase